jgi:hypothetical protein
MKYFLIAIAATLLASCSGMDMSGASGTYGRGESGSGIPAAQDTNYSYTHGVL